MKVCLALCDIRSSYNVGAVLRTAEGMGVRQVVFAGYTPRPDDPRVLPHVREKQNRQIAKSALGAERMIPQESTEDLPEWLRRKKSGGWEIVGLENNLCPEETAKRVVLGRQKFGEEIALVLGEEVKGISTEVRNECDWFLEIPMVGRKESFNVSVAAGMALWGLMGEEMTKEKSSGDRWVR